MKKIMAAIVVIGLVFLAFFYLYSRSGDVYQSVDADLITLSSSGREDIEIEKRAARQRHAGYYESGKTAEDRKNINP